MNDTAPSSLFPDARYVPTSMTELGGKEEDIPYLAHTAAYGNEGSGCLGRFVVLKE